MVKPLITSFSTIAPLIVHKYERYLPTAFDESLTLLEKVNKVIQYCNNIGIIVDGIVEQWNEVMEWVMADGLTAAVNVRLDEMVLDGTFDTIINQNIFGELNTKTNRISITEYSSLKVLVNGEDDWFPAIDKAISDAQLKGVTEVFIPKGVFTYRNTINVPKGIDLVGIGESEDASVLSYKGASGGWAIKTDGLHQRNSLKHFRLDLNGLGNGIKIGLLGGSLVPIIIDFCNISVANVGSGYWGVEFNNCSHITLDRLRIGYGSIVGGNGLRIYADGGINSGVFMAEDCVLGRVDATDIALEINGSVNVDSYKFLSCYIGGQRVKIGENTVVRSINFDACHAEFRLISGSPFANIDAFQLFKVYGGSWKDGSVTCFGGSGSNLFVFKSDVRKFNITGVEANAVMGSVFKQVAGTTLEGCILQEANLTNGSTATQFDGVSDFNMKLLAKRLQHEILNVKTIYSIDQVNKEYWGTEPDPLQGHTRGDIIKNSLPSRTKNIKQWHCVVGGSAGGGTFMAEGVGRGTTIERPALTLKDDGYVYFDETLARFILWNGSAWVG